MKWYWLGTGRGSLLLNLFSTSANLSGDVCSTLLGSTSLFLLFYHKIFSVTFDKDLARASGTKEELYNWVIAVAIAVVIMLVTRLVGSLLISALIIFPAMSAMRLFRSSKGVILFSVVLSVSCALAGILISIVQGTPVGSTIVATDIAAFMVCAAVEKFKGGRKREAI